VMEIEVAGGAGGGLGASLACGEAEHERRV
jgi:hypothetical protein